MRYKYSRLPAGYTGLEYIQSSGTQWIDTGFIPNKNSGAEVECMTGSNKSIFGANYLDFNITNTFTVAFSIVSTSERYNYGAKYNTKYKLKLNKGLFYVNDELKYTFTIRDFSSSTLTVKLLSRGSGNDDQFIGRTYYFKLYDNDTLVRNFIPAKRDSDNEIGMYDIVNGVFYTNQGTGSFVAGPEVDNSITIRKLHYKTNNGWKTMYKGKYLTSTRNLLPPFSDGVITTSQTKTSGNVTIKQTYSGNRQLHFVDERLTGTSREGNYAYYIFNITLDNLKPNTNYTLSADVALNSESGGGLYYMLSYATVGVGKYRWKRSKQMKTDDSGHFGPDTILNLTPRGDCVWDLELSNLQLEEGSTATPYVPNGHVDFR